MLCLLLIVQDLYATFTKTKIFIEHFRFGFVIVCGKVDNNSKWLLMCGYCVWPKFFFFAVDNRMIFCRTIFCWKKREKRKRGRMNSESVAQNYPVTTLVPPLWLLFRTVPIHFHGTNTFSLEHIRQHVSIVVL